MRSTTKRRVVEACGVVLLFFGVGAVGAGTIVAIVLAPAGLIVAPVGWTGFPVIKRGWSLLMRPEDPWRAE